jgi:hypothetical protein
MQYPTMVMFNMTEPPIKEEHVSWYVNRYEEDGKEIYTLYETVLAFYRHPDAPDMMTVKNLEIRNRGRVESTDLIASPYIVMYHVQQTMSMVARTR